MIGLLILVVELQIPGEVPCHGGQLDILADDLPVHPQSQLLVGIDHLAQVLPAPGGGKLQAVHGGLDAVEILLADIEIGDDGPVKPPGAGVLLPDGEVLLHVDALDPVQRHHIEIPDGLVVLRGVARRHDEPALRQLLIAEGLALEKLQHHGGQGLGDTVDLVQE